MKIPATTIVVALIAASAMADEVSFSGITLGETGCDETLAMIEREGFGDTSLESYVTGGSAAILSRGAFNQPFVLEGSLHCDENNNAVAKMNLVIPKNKANEIADALGRRHQQRSRRLPNLGPGEARYVSQSGLTQARLRYVHVSFEALLELSTTDFAERERVFNKSMEQQRRESVDGAFE